MFIYLFLLSFIYLFIYIFLSPFAAVCLLNQGERLREAALLLEGTAAAAASPYLLSLSSFAYLDAALVGCLTVFSLLLVSALLKGMLAYKREREVEGA